LANARAGRTEERIAERPSVCAIDFGTSNSLLAAANRDRIFDAVPLEPGAPDPTSCGASCFPDA
jgi:hypothetical chaperone protein